MKQKIRIAAGQGFWGDLLDAPVRQVEGGPIDYLMLDYLAEVTMSILQKQHSGSEGRLRQDCAPDETDTAGMRQANIPSNCQRRRSERRRLCRGGA